LKTGLTDLERRILWLKKNRAKEPFSAVYVRSGKSTRAYEAEAERMHSCLMEFPSKFSYAMNAVKRNIVSCEEELRNLKREREWFENIIAIKQRKKNDKKKMVAVA